MACLKTLSFCTEHQQDLVRPLAKSAPHCTNIRDADTGETVLHRLTRTRQSLQTWLDVCPDVPPVADGQGKTTVEVALRLNQIDAAQALWQKLPPSTTSIAASLLLQNLWSLPDECEPLVVAEKLSDQKSYIQWGLWSYGGPHALGKPMPRPCSRLREFYLLRCVCVCVCVCVRTCACVCVQA